MLSSRSSRGRNEVARRDDRVTFALFDNPIRPEQQRRRDGEAERLGGLEVDDELELRRLLDGEISGLCAFENFSNVTGDAVQLIEKVRAIRHQAASLHMQSIRIYGRQSTLDSEVRNPLSLVDEHRIADDIESLDVFSRHCRECFFNRAGTL